MRPALLPGRWPAAATRHAPPAPRGRTSSTGATTGVWTGVAGGDGVGSTGRPVGDAPCRGRQFHAREGHLRVGRNHVEDTAGDGGESVSVRLGGWLDNTRRRSDRLTPERRAALDALGMRW
ncbi:helicase associated domain-containing protein [Streptomyces mirabilis]|uniref:helicase associated domain-containing protein n=1 Tax=Streptomyces mirabilis TaxID=68239 RepID=UPI0033334CB2